MSCSKCAFCLLLTCIAAAYAGSEVRADFITIAGNQGVKNLGSFEGTLTYAAQDSQHAILTLVLKNTSPIANGGFLTAFAFNNPNDQISKVKLTGKTNFQLIGAPKFNNNINGAPFGHFDIAAGIPGSFQGSGPPNKGIAVGATQTLTFLLTGKDLDKLNALNFANEFSAPPSDKCGTTAFEARFRDFKGCADGDHVPGAILAKTPEPSALLLGSIGVVAGIHFYRRRTRNRPADR